eukprot:m.110276 g.110276  ORF g.110276 m.110276 type:complete len:586 (-) comp16033_c0_seq3:126-1883(-)
MRLVTAAVFLVSALVGLASGSSLAHGRDGRAVASAWPFSGSNYCAVPSTTGVRPDHTCADFGSLQAASIALHAMRGESESAQILFRNEETTLTQVTVAASPFSSSQGDVAAVVPEVQVSAVGYVDCRHSPRYGGSGGHWRPDPLLAVPSAGLTVPAATTQAFWITVVVPEATPAGNYTSKVTVSAAGQPAVTVPVSIEVWDIVLPSLNASKIGTAWSGSWTPSYFEPYYNTSWNKTQWYDAMTTNRMPPDAIYTSAPRPMDDYEYLAGHGARWMALMDVCNLHMDDGDVATPNPGVGEGGSCANYSDAYVEKLIATLKPAVEALRAKGWIDRAYVYGFDENPVSCEPQVRKLFGATKKAFPDLRTMAVLNWHPMPVDLPVDVWVLQYEEYVASDAQAWIKAGKQQWWYHCIEPSGLNNLNTFIERPLIQDRLLFWLAACAHAGCGTYGVGGAPSGWLYYAVNLWNPAPKLPRKVMRTVNNTAYTDFDPANYIWAGQYDDIWANGDGQYLYPGEDGPLETVRLQSIRDGLEDWELFSMLPAATAAPLLAALVQGPESWVEDSAALFAARRQAAAAIQAAAAGTPKP